MMRRFFVTCALALGAAAAGCGTPELPGARPGTPAPDFSMTGVDGRVHRLQDYKDSRVLALVFTSNTCPVSQLYEARIQRLFEDYRDKGVSVVAVNPNRPEAMHLADLAYSDVGESLEDMALRAGHRQLSYPYLSDADSQSAATALGVVTTPHVFVFDRGRALRYSGPIDDSLREDAVQSHYARDAIESLLAGRTVADGRRPPIGCAVKGTTATGPDPELARFENGPVAVQLAGAEELGRLRRNGTGKLLMVNFWATWCAPCVTEFPHLESTYRRFEPRGLRFVTVSVNDPEERGAVLEFLKAQHASHDNRLFATSDVYGLQAAFDPDLPAPVPFTLLLAPNGDVLYQELGEVNAPKLRRAILANLPDDSAYPGLQAYWRGPS